MKKKLLVFGLIIFTSMLVSACANMYVSGGVGMSYYGGPYGGYGVSPRINVGMYGGGMRW